MFFVLISHNDRFSDKSSISTTVMDEDETQKLFDREWVERKAQDFKVDETVHYVSGLSDETFQERCTIIRIV